MNPLLFKYQVEGSLWLSTKNCALLADKQRLGKSAQLITACDLVDAKKIIVVCRAVARFQWGSEFEKWSDRKRKINIVLSGTENNPPETESVTICGYETFDWILESGVCGFDVVIIDESHSLKSIEAKRTKKILGKEGLSRRSKRIWLASGTPAPNHYGELWTTAYTFGATKLGYWDFVKKFCITRPNGFTERGIQIVGSRNDPQTVAELKTLLKSIMLRRTEDDVGLELPKLNFSTVMVEPGPIHLGMTSFCRYVLPFDKTAELDAKVIEEFGILDSIIKQGEKNGYASEQFLEIIKSQAKGISTLRRYNALQKLDGACDLIRSELEDKAYHKCVIFAIHKDAIEGARLRLKDFSPVTLYGKSNPYKAEENIKQFQNPKSKVRVFIGNILAAGTSISLDVANHIFFLEEDWVPGNNAQAAMRCGGMRQKNPIFVRNFCLNNSIDRRVQEILRDKMRDLSLLFDSEGAKNEKLLDLF